MAGIDEKIEDSSCAPTRLYTGSPIRRSSIGMWPYSNRLAVADAPEWLAQALARSQVFQARHADRADIDLRYGEGDRQTYDIYHPDGSATGTLVFVHGGYWRMTAKEDYRVFASGALAAGWRVVLLEYPLCPAVRVGDISRLVVKAARPRARAHSGRPP